jgi:hypothetical protein
MPAEFLFAWRRITAFAVLVVLQLVLAPAAFAQNDPLPSWNDGASKTAIVEFVGRVARDGGPDFVPLEERIAVFDNDGTLWSEQPVYFQAAFIFDRIREMAKDHPEWKQTQPYKAVLENDLKAIASDQKGLVQLLNTTHSGMSVEAFAERVEEWAKTARHPRFDRPYVELVFQPMLELLYYLRANGFKTYIVSGGGVEFMRPWVPQVYGIPPEQIIGSSGKTEFRLNGGKPVIFKLPGIEFVDDGPGKPVGINRFIGRRPVFAAGNSDGDLQMLQWTTLNDGPRFGLLVHHTDEKREWAYDRKSSVGKLDKALDEAPSRGWTVVDMKSDWKVIYPFEKE